MKTVAMTTVTGDKPLEYMKVKSKKKKAKKTIKQKQFQKILFVLLSVFLTKLSFLYETIDKWTNRLPGVFTISTSLAAIVYSHEVLKSLVGPVDYKVITGTLFTLFLLGCKSEYHSYKKKLRMEKELKKKRKENV